MVMGIRGQLLIAFWGSAIITGIIGLVGWLSFAQMRTVVDGIAKKDIPTIASAFRLADNVNNMVAAATIAFASARDESARTSGLRKLKEYDQDLRATTSTIVAAEGREKILPIENLRESIFANLGHLDKTLAHSLHGAEQYRQRAAKPHGWNIRSS